MVADHLSRLPKTLYRVSFFTFTAIQRYLLYQNFFVKCPLISGKRVKFDIGSAEMKGQVHGSHVSVNNTCMAIIAN